MKIDAIGLDADDTLWHNEVIFEETHTRYCALLSRFHDADTVARTLHATEMRNLELFGYGIKGYALSSIETAISLTHGEISAEEIRSILDLAKDMMRRPVVLLPGAEETVRILAREHDLILITKGDLHDQQRKIARSGLADLFTHTEVVAEKDRATYARILERSRVVPNDSSWWAIRSSRISCPCWISEEPGSTCPTRPPGSTNGPTDPKAMTGFTRSSRWRPCPC